MLAATHWLNASLHALHANGESTDVLHTYMLTVNEFRRLSAAHQALMEMVAEIEDLRPVNVRGDTPGAEAAAERAAEADPWRPSPLNRKVQDRLFSGIFRSLS